MTSDVNPNFEKNWLAVAGILVVFASLPILMIFGFVVKLLAALENNKNFVEINFPNVMLIFLIFFLTFFCLWFFVTTLRIKFTDEGVSQKGLFNQRFILWKDVKYIESIPYGLIIGSNQKKMRLFLIFFKDINQILIFIKERVEFEPVS